MTRATEHSWTIVIQGADRSELSEAFRSSPWKDSWYERMSLLDDGDPDAGYVVTLAIPDLDTLIAALKCVGHLKPTYGMALCGQAEFGSLRARSSLCTKASGFDVSSFTLHRTVASFGSEMESKVSEAEKALGELRVLVAQNEARAEDA